MLWEYFRFSFGISIARLEPTVPLDMISYEDDGMVQYEFQNFYKKIV